MKRQTLILGAAGLAALGLGAGVGIGWQRRRDQATASPDEPPWSLRFPRPEGGELVMSGFRGRPLVLNFWATWCPPCVKEMPALDRFQREFSARGWQVVGLAVDQAGPVLEFLGRQPVSFAVGLAGFAGTELSRHFGNEAGGLPFTVVFDRHGQVLRRKIGETSFDELAEWAAQG